MPYLCIYCQISYFFMSIYIGELFSQFGLLYISMGLFDLGIEHFERALPLVRKGKETDSSSQLELEASILQNIGAAYNEKSLFMEAIVYHQEAIVLHGEFT